MSPQIILKISFFGLIITAVLLEVAADIFFKKWSIGNKNMFLLIGLLLYATGTVFWAFSLKYEFLSKSASIFTVLNLILIIFAGALFFGEKLSFINKIGIITGIISIILLEI
ncbi:MAG: EamA family transporter [Candidatus Staskawiczbacteria bacterium]|nr:EamA family transporter [Candidatus Staskawiczbacteria bacterium]